MDGVSCSLCHQIDAQGLSEYASFTGGYVIDTTTFSPYRWIYGSFTQPVQNPMQMHVGYTPVYGAHVNGSAYCGSCHTLYTPIVDAQGQISGEFPEQTPYLEWKHSDFSAADDTKHCQDCHTPEGPGAVVLSNRPHWLSARSGVGQHIMVGGNRFLLDILKAHATELGVTADAAHLDATAALTAEQLTQHTAQLSILSQEMQDDALVTVLQISDLAGHKFPTGVPIRRAWLHVRATDKRGRVVFESGAPASDGHIVENDADKNADTFEPHYDEITAPDQVQIYETVMCDTAGRVTYTFLNAARYLKDNRLLPRGFNKLDAPADIAVHGAALADGNFTGGADRVTYRIDLSQVGQSQRPVQFTARLLYQQVGRRFMDDLRYDDTAEVSRFVGYYDAADKTPVVIATVP
jgi:mono/diheme cytochrome c family protein